MKKSLLFFTSTYPYGKNEAFIENEIHYLSTSFDTIILITNDCTTIEKRDTPPNIIIERRLYNLSSIQKKKSWKWVFSSHFWKELSIIKNRYHHSISWVKIKTLLSTLQKSKQLASYIQQLIEKHHLSNTTLYLYSYWNSDNAVGLAYYKTLNPNVTAITRAHGWDVYFEANNSGYLPLRKFIANCLDGIFFISEKGKSYTSHLLQSNFPSFLVARLGVQKQELPRFEDKKDTLCLLSCSNVIPLKRIELIIQSLAFVKTTVHWVHFGDGIKLDEMKQLANDCLKSNGIVSYEFKGRVTNQELLTYYKTNRVDLFINLSTTEGIPVSIMEAMSFGIPAIATDVGGTNELVEDNKNGFLLPFNVSAKEVTQAIEHYFYLPTETKHFLSTQAWHTFNTKFNAQLNYQAFINTVFQLKQQQD